MTSTLSSRRGAPIPCVDTPMSFFMQGISEDQVSHCRQGDEQGIWTRSLDVSREGEGITIRIAVQA